jgi:hypothetical protein
MGGNCDGTVSTYSEGSCGGTETEDSYTPNKCEGGLTNKLSVSVKVGEPNGATCEKSGGESTGTVEGAKPLRICCNEP